MSKISQFNSIFLLASVSVFFIGCSTFTSGDKSVDSQELNRLQRKLSDASDRIEHLEDKNSILKSLLAGGGASSLTSSSATSPAIKNSTVPSSTGSAISDVQAEKNVFKEQAPRGDEKKIYHYIVTAFKSKNLSRLIAGQIALEKDFPESPYLDNAIYFVGKIHLQNGSFGQALRQFDRVIKEFPLGNKRVSAIYGKAQTHLKMNLIKMARDSYNQVVKEYPNSLEANRAKIEIRLLKGKKA
ncbi:MAG: tetratricopeptide repeat protein [Bdellovibrionales bacterium]